MQFPDKFELNDGTHVVVIKLDDETFEFHLTRLNSEKHNFYWNIASNTIEESYETRFDMLQNESVKTFRSRLGL